MSIHSFGSNEPIDVQLSVPPRQRRTYRLPASFYDYLRLQARSSGSAPGEVVVEPVPRLDGDGTSRPRAMGAIGALLR